jgi:hypothetical protein
MLGFIFLVIFIIKMFTMEIGLANILTEWIPFNYFFDTMITRSKIETDLSLKII